MRRVLLALFMLIVPVGLAAQTRVDFDRHQDFSQYKTFTVEVEPPIRADGVVDEYNTLAEKRLRDAVTNELHARGLEATDAAAALTVRVSSRETKRTVLMTSGWRNHSWGWRRRWGYSRYYWHHPWGYWEPYDDVWTRRYTEISTTVDIVDRASGDLVYRAQVTDELGSNLDKQAIKTVDKAFKKFPVKEIADH